MCFSWMVFMKMCGGVVRKNKVWLSWRRDHVESVVWSGGVVVLLVGFLRQKSSSQMMVRLLCRSMVVDR